MNKLNLAKIFLISAIAVSGVSVFYESSNKFFTVLSVCLSLISFIVLFFVTDKKTKYPVSGKELSNVANSKNNPNDAQKNIRNTVSLQNQTAKKELNDAKTEVLNKFASVVSHDLKNPLSGLKNIAYYFTNSVKVDGEVPNKMLKMLSSEVDRMNDMIVNLLDFTRVKQLSKSNTELTSIIEAAVKSCENGKYSFETRLQPLTVYADSERIKQVFSSIIQNAKEAMPEGGTIKIESYQNEGKAFIEISDNGTGMDHDTLEKCFDPMFSTKQARALGMSLTVSKQIVEMHDCSIKAESIVGKGSKFIVSLPIAV